MLSPSCHNCKNINFDCPGNGWETQESKVCCLVFKLQNTYLKISSNIHLIVCQVVAVVLLTYEIHDINEIHDIYEIHGIHEIHDIYDIPDIYDSVCLLLVSFLFQYSLLVSVSVSILLLIYEGIGTGIVHLWYR